MVIKLLILNLIFLLSCNFSDSKFVRKVVKNDDIKITWFYYSYISNVSPDFLVVTKGEKEIEIFNANRVLLDVAVNHDSIILKIVKPIRNLVLKYEVSNEPVFGYKIILDSTGDYEEFQTIPKGVKESIF